MGSWPCTACEISIVCLVKELGQTPVLQLEIPHETVMIGSGWKEGEPDSPLSNSHSISRIATWVQCPRR